MAQVKKTKTALKAQRDALERYLRYLPTLELKKQQLRMEIRRLEQQIQDLETEKENIWTRVSEWVRLFGEEFDLAEYVVLREVRTREENIAGISVQVVDEVSFEHPKIDLFGTAPWVDDGLAVTEDLVRVNLREALIREARDRVADELRITSQRVNLFEKIKIPETRENIRTIRVALGDEQTAAVARAKIAKRKISEAETARL